MSKRETIIAWRMFELNWLPLALMCAALALGFTFTDFSIEPGGMLGALGVVAIYASFAYYNAKAPHRRDPQVVFVLGSMAQLALVVVVMGPLTYLAGAIDMPMQDANLQAIDQALGLDWLGYLNFVNDRPVLASWLSYGYGMIKWPILAIPVILSATGRFVRLQELTLAFSVALIITTIVSAFVPAIGVFQQLGLNVADFPNVQSTDYLNQLRDMPLVRDGSLRRLDLFTLTGIVTLPSFHAASAALFAWAFWPVRWFRPVAIVANGMMLAATPIDGAHYFIDVIAGIAVAVLGIVAARMTSRAIATAGAESSLAVPNNVAIDAPGLGEDPPIAAGEPAPFGSDLMEIRRERADRAA